jgi:hypothetical protein
MTTILSCGHIEDDFDKHYNIMTKDWSRENTKAVGYKTVCLSCRRAYAKDGLLLINDNEAMNWLKD